MLRRVSTFISNNRRFIPISATALLAIVAYAVGALNFEGMQNPQVFLNLFRNSSYYLISAIGMTFVILTGGIDLSVSGVVVLTSVVSAALLRDGANPWGVILLVLAMGMTLGAIMGSFIVYLKVQPFIATLAGMWFAKGMCFFISDNAINIDNRIFKILGQTKILIPGLKELAESQGNQPPYISIPVVVGFIVLIVAIYLAHYTRFGRTVYAIGGNEQSARLMGLPVNRTLMLVYTFNGFCSALAGLAFALFVSSGHGLYAPGFELDVIASVVMGGTMLTGGAGYVIGTLFGVMVLAVTQVLIQFIGSLSSWWTKIVIGLLTLIFIGVQSILAARKESHKQTQDPQALAAARLRRRRQAFAGGGVVILVALAIVFVPRTLGSDGVETAEASACAVAPFRKDEAASLIDEGAVLVYNRTAGPFCVDEIYAIYPDGRVSGDSAEHKTEAQVSIEDVERLLSTISNDYGWFTDGIYDTYLAPCRQCFAHYVLVSYDGQEKGATGVDGTTAMPSEYGLTLSVIRPLLPEMNPVP
jgi:ribose/xylose/arabinose/galactoside ABC-type transport system permease subunit